MSKKKVPIWESKKHPITGFNYGDRKRTQLSKEEQKKRVKKYNDNQKAKKAMNAIKTKIQKLQQQKDRLIEKLGTLKDPEKIKLQKAAIKNIESNILNLKKNV